MTLRELRDSARPRWIAGRLIGASALAAALAITALAVLRHGP